MTNSLSAQKPQLMYFGDPMCSWCYGFSEEFSQAVNNLDNQIELKFVMGGLRPYNQETMTDLKSFLKEHWQEVSARTGQKFSYDILEEPDMLYDTEPACRATVAFREMYPGRTMDFFKAAQHAFYFKNKNPNIASTYTEIVESMGLDSKAYEISFLSDEMKLKVKEDFEFAAGLGAQSFPTVILKKGDDYYLVAQGYAKAEVLEKNVLKILNEL